MAISTRGVSAITDLMTSVTEGPDFSFLNDWKPKVDSSFFPRLNNSPQAKIDLNGDDRAKLRVTISAVEEVNTLFTDTGLELSSNKGFFSNSISVFHRDGEVSIVALPVTSATQKAMGGFLLASDLWNIPNAKLFVKGLKDLSDLIPPTQKYLQWRWWPVAKDERRINRRSAAQLLLAATNPGDRNIHVISELIESRSSLSTGKRIPTIQEWKLALTKLESLKEFPADALIITLSVDQMPELQKAITITTHAFERQADLNAEVKEELQNLIEKRTKKHIDGISINDFAEKFRGQGFPKKLLCNRFEEHAPNRLAANDQIPTVGSILRLAKKAPFAFNTQSLDLSIQLMETYVQDQRLIRGCPRLTDSDASFEEFLRKIYKLYLDQARPYPARAQFDALTKLVSSKPEELYLLARSEDSVKRLIGSFDTYIDPVRLTKLQEVYVEPSVNDARQYFKENPATYQAILSSLGFNALTLEQISGFLAPELTKAIRAIEIDTSGMKSPLRSYQTFGVQYALHQKRVILGDEMGLGKTVTALGLAKHLQSNGHSRFLVIVPLGVLENWRREILKHTDFIPKVLYGEELETNLKSWVAEAGIALATFESIQKVNAHYLTSTISALDLVVADEAHYLKNPETRRAIGVLPWIQAAERALLMTGTPLENKLEEFEQLIHYVQPHLAMPVNKAAYTEFRKAISPAYLRRNQIDVLQELPELQDDEEFIELSEADKEYYRRALEANDWNRARRAKILAGPKSSTVQRIQDIVSESMANGHKVLIFSFYREVISILQRNLKDDDPYTPLTGDLNSLERQQQVDSFTSSEKPGVLLAQITAGGTGLNIQAASVVIIVEPQVKPSLESQAIRRAYRMGQTKNVRVIRLRAKDTIDARWVLMLNEKLKLFDATAGVSDVNSFDDAVSGQQGSIFKAEKAAWGVLDV